MGGEIPPWVSDVANKSFCEFYNPEAAPSPTCSEVESRVHQYIESYLKAILLDSSKIVCPMGKEGKKIAWKGNVNRTIADIRSIVEKIENMRKEDESSSLEKSQKGGRVHYHHSSDNHLELGKMLSLMEKMKNEILQRGGHSRVDQVAMDGMKEVAKELTRGRVSPQTNEQVRQKKLQDLEELSEKIKTLMPGASSFSEQRQETYRSDALQKAEIESQLTITQNARTPLGEEGVFMVDGKVVSQEKLFDALFSLLKIKEDVKTDKELPDTVLEKANQMLLDLLSINWEIVTQTVLEEYKKGFGLEFDGLQPLFLRIDNCDGVLEVEFLQELSFFYMDFVEEKQDHLGKSSFVLSEDVSQELMQSIEDGRAYWRVDSDAVSKYSKDKKIMTREGMLDWTDDEELLEEISASQAPKDSDIFYSEKLKGDVEEKKVRIPLPCKACVRASCHYDFSKWKEGQDVDMHLEFYVDSQQASQVTGKGARRFFIDSSG